MGLDEQLAVADATEHDAAAFRDRDAFGNKVGPIKTRGHLGLANRLPDTPDIRQVASPDRVLGKCGKRVNVFDAVIDALLDQPAERFHGCVGIAIEHFRQRLVEQRARILRPRSQRRAGRLAHRSVVLGLVCRDQIRARIGVVVGHCRRSRQHSTEYQHPSHRHSSAAWSASSAGQTSSS